MSDMDYEHIIEQLEQISSDIDKIKEVIIGKMNNDHPGLLERIRRMEEWVDVRKRFEWLLLTSIVVEIVGLVFIAVKVAILP